MIFQHSCDEEEVLRIPASSSQFAETCKSLQGFGEESPTILLEQYSTESSLLLMRSVMK
jgi:hypothetical protein